jgi:vacuolar-type H+-ATPase subunit C/Vma6
MQTQKYASVLAKIGAERSKLLDEAKIKGLAENRSLLEVVGQLRDTSYQEQLLHVTPPLTGVKLERAYHENLIETLKKILVNAPKKTVPYLELGLLRFEVEHVKGLLKATAFNLTPEQKLAKIYVAVEDYFGRHFVFEDAAKAVSVPQVINAFKGTPYWVPLNLGLKSYEENGSTTGFDVFVDKLYFEHLTQAYQKLPKRERKHADFYASMELDCFVLLTLLRGKILQLDSNWLRLVVPPKPFKLSSTTVEALVTALDYEAALKIVLATPYSKYFVHTDDPQTTVANAEKAFRRAMLHHAQASIIHDVFNIGVTLAYLTQKQAEVHNLTASSLGVDSGVKAEEILSQLLL